eukprot:COSAG04_NODE_6623_length_1290_cov_1.471872_2_plen_331_part_00
MAGAAPHISDLPEPALRRILLTATTHDNLLRHVAACARVCAEWRRVVMSNEAYGLALPRGRLEGVAYRGDDDERARVLRAIVGALERPQDPKEQGSLLYVDVADTPQRCPIGDAGVAALGAALQAMPQIPFDGLTLDCQRLTVAGIKSIIPALRCQWGERGVLHLRLPQNPELGDAGVAALAAALPPTLLNLFLYDTGCGDEGFVALAAALPALTNLRDIFLGNLGVRPRGWAAVAAALPSLPMLEGFSACCDWAIPRHLIYEEDDLEPGRCLMGAEGAASIAAAVPDCHRLEWLNAEYCGLPASAKAALRRARFRPNPAPGQTSLSIMV